MIGSLREMLNAFENGTTDFTKNGSCSACGQCCSNVLPMSKTEIHDIKCYIKKNGIKEQKHFAPFAQAAIADLTCPFLDNSKELKCTIYEVRPLVCREFCCNKNNLPKETKMTLKTHEIVFVRETFFGDKK